VIAEHDADCGALYRTERRELLDLLRDLDAGELGAEVPATPGWDVRDVVAHLTGITADLNAQRFDDPSPEAWTERQVRSRRGSALADLEAEWEQEAGQFEEGLRLLGYEIGSHYVGDLLQHSQDVREALRRPSLDDDLALAVALDFYLDVFSQALVGRGLGAVVVRAGEESWTVGRGDVVATVGADRLPLFRAFGGRTSPDGLAWTGDVDRVRSAVDAYG
jgi:uncharacterized protein (TIGR03083 family)